MTNAAKPTTRVGTHTKETRQILASTVIGTTIEWFDFFIYGISASLIFGALFFPSDEPLVGTLLALSSFALGFAARPIGGIIAGHFGDRIGRKKVLMLTMVVMGIATVLIGLMPTYETIGIAAPILLTVLRVIQGMAVGGEWGGAVLIAAEHAPVERRGLWASWPQIGAPAGSVLATGFMAILNGLLSEEQFNAWGWRVPFLASVVLVGVGAYIRMKIPEPEVFEEEVASEKAPAIEVLRDHTKPFLLGVMLYFSVNVVYYILVSFSLVYVENSGSPRSIGLWGVFFASIVQAFVLPAAGLWSDKVGRKPPYFIGVIGSILFVFALFPMLGSGSLLIVSIALTIALFFHALMYAPQAAMFAELFPTRVRYTGISMGVQVCSIFAGGLAPVIATAILRDTGSWQFIAIYIAAASMLTLIALFIVPETRGRDLTGDIRGGNVVGSEEDKKARLNADAKAARRSATGVKPSETD